MIATKRTVALGLLASVVSAASVAAAEPSAEVAAQIANGQKLFAAHCAKCHGDAGQGTKKAPAVVGKNALPLDPPAAAQVRKTKFRTAKDVAEFAVKNMPGDDAGSLKAEEYWAILAFDLKANGVELKQKLDEKLAATITLHP
jgi:cytochrome c